MENGTDEKIPFSNWFFIKKHVPFSTLFQN